MMTKPRPALTLAALLFTLFGTAAHAVRLSENGQGEVLLLPLFSVQGSDQTELTVSNTTEAAKALRVIVKDPLLGRPLLTLNLYLKPRDSWTGRLLRSPESDALPRLISADESCTFPEIPAHGLPATQRFLGEVSGDRAPERLRSGFMEIYEMGGLDSDLAADCQAIAERWASGAWRADRLTTPRNAGLEAPAGGLTGLAAIKSVESGRSFQIEPVVLDRFMNEPLHIHPNWPVRPSLMDVRPAVAEIPSVLRLGELVIRSTAPQSFSETPVHAVDALLMTQGLSSVYSSDQPGLTLSTVVVTMPTRPYHSDPDGFYLRGRARVLAPFATSTPLQPGELRDADLLQGTAVSGSGEVFDLLQSPGADACDATESTVNAVTLTNQLNFSRVCDLGDAEIFVQDGQTRGELSLQFNGQVISDEGETFRGLPVIGYLLQDTVGRAATGPNPVFARPARRQPQE